MEAGSAPPPAIVSDWVARNGSEMPREQSKMSIFAHRPHFPVIRNQIFDPDAARMAENIKNLALLVKQPGVKPEAVATWLKKDLVKSDNYTSIEMLADVRKAIDNAPEVNGARVLPGLSECISQYNGCKRYDFALGRVNEIRQAGNLPLEHGRAVRMNKRVSGGSLKLSDEAGAEVLEFTATDMDIITDSGRILNAKTSQTARQWEKYDRDQNWLLAAAYDAARAGNAPGNVPGKEHWEKVKFLVPPGGMEKVPRGHRDNLNNFIQDLQKRLGDNIDLFPNLPANRKWEGFFAEGIKLFPRP